MAKASDGLNAKQRKLKAEEAARSKRQIKKIEAEKEASRKKSEAAELKMFAERVKKQAEKRKKIDKRVAELHQLDLKKQAIRKRYS